MFIFLGIVGELATVIGSVAITLNASRDSVLEISKRGYKIDKNVLDEYSRKKIEEEKQKINGPSQLLGTILLFVPGVNLISSSINSAKLKKSFMDDPQIKEAMIPMTDKEKEQYERMDTKRQKLTCAVFNTMKENDKEEAQDKANSSDLQVYSEAPGVEIGYAKSDVPLEDMMCCMEDSIFDGSTQEQGQGSILKKELIPQRKTK